MYMHSSHVHATGEPCPRTSVPWGLIPKHEQSVSPDCQFRFTIQNTAYKNEYIEDSGGVMLTDNGTQFSFTLEEVAAFKEALKGVHVLIDEMYVAIPMDLTAASWMAAYNFSEADMTSGDYPFLEDSEHPPRTV